MIQTQINSQVQTSAQTIKNNISKVILLLGTLCMGVFFAYLLIPRDIPNPPVLLPDGQTPRVVTPTPPPPSPEAPNPSPTPNNPNPLPTPKPAPTPSPSSDLPRSVLLNVPFTPQAPTGNWDELHGEACEEASAIMAYAYFSGRKDKTLPPTFVEDELAKLTQWEKDTFGYYLDITSPETAQLIEENYGLKTEIISNYSVDNLKQALADGKVIIIATAGQLLGNPNFRAPGPPYHMFPIIGYNETHFITNDPGTRKGAKYEYSYDTILNAGGEWSHSDDKVHTNKKYAILVSAK